MKPVVAYLTHGLSMELQPDDPSYFVFGTASSAIADWPTWFKDYADGKDIVRWTGLALKEHLPGLVEDEVLRDDSFVDLALPLFVDTAPFPGTSLTPPGAKVKFGGKSEPAVAFLTSDQLVIDIRDWRGRATRQVTELADIREVGVPSFALSKLSMTSAGPGFEIITSRGRQLFRLAVEPREKRFVSIVTDRLMRRIVPLFTEVEAVRWVKPGSDRDPATEEGPERHRPYIA